MALIIVALLVGKGIPYEDVYLDHTLSGKDVSRDADTILNKTVSLKAGLVFWMLSNTKLCKHPESGDLVF